MAAKDEKKAPEAKAAHAPAPARAAAPAAPAAPAPQEPAFNKTSWMSMANLRLGVSPHVVAAALHGEPNHAQLTEADVRRRIKATTEQSL